MDSPVAWRWLLRLLLALCVASASELNISSPTSSGCAAHLAHNNNREGVECAYAMTVSRNWIPGFMTLLHSVERANGPHDHCGYVFLWNPMVPDSQLSAQEKKMIKHIVGSKPTIYHRVDSDRLSYFKRVPHLRSGVLLAWMKLDLFYGWANECGMPQQIIFLDTDMLVLNSLTFIQHHLAREALSNRSNDKWVLHGSANWYGVAGWLFSADMTPVKPQFVNTGFLAFRRPAPVEFLNALQRRIEERIHDDLKIYIADQDVINNAFDSAHLRTAALHVHRNWYANYRPNSDETLRSWRVAHWMGVEKPWGKKGHTNAPVRFNDRALPRLDNMWLDECMQMATRAASVANLTIDCGDGVVRNVPGRVDASAYYLGLALLAIAFTVWHTIATCQKRYGDRCACSSVSAALSLWVFAVYLTADWDHAGWVREPLGLAEFEFANG